MRRLECIDASPCAPECFIVEVCSELQEETLRNRWEHVNVLLRMSMLTGLQMQLDATLNLLCDMAAEIAKFESAIVYFWEENQELMQLRIVRNLEKPAGEEIFGNILNFWAIKHG